MKLSAAGISLLTTLEGKRSKPYLDAVGLWSNGIGHLYTNQLVGRTDAPWSDAKIMQTLRNDLYQFETTVMDACLSGGLKPSQSQFDGMVLLAFNIGHKGFTNSTVLRRFLNRDNAGAASAFLLWNKITINGKKVASRALEARRIAESRVFLHGYYDATPYNSLDDDEKLKALIIPRNTYDHPTQIVPSESEARPDLNNSRTMKASVLGQAGSGLAAASATAGIVKSIADQTKAAADSAGDAVRSVNDAAQATGDVAGLLSNTSFWIYGAVGVGALIAITAFISVRRARRDDWQRGWR